jgi:hypothetical protein
MYGRPSASWRQCFVQCEMERSNHGRLTVPVATSWASRRGTCVAAAGFAASSEARFASRLRPWPVPRVAPRAPARRTNRCWTSSTSTGSTCAALFQPVIYLARFGPLLSEELKEWAGLVIYHWVGGENETVTDGWHFGTFRRWPYGYRTLPLSEIENLEQVSSKVIQPLVDHDVAQRSKMTRSSTTVHECSRARLDRVARGAQKKKDRNRKLASGSHRSIMSSAFGSRVDVSIETRRTVSSDRKHELNQQLPGPRALQAPLRM